MSEESCLFCNKAFINFTDVTKKPTLQGFSTIFSTAEIRRDATSLKILSLRDKIRRNPIHFKYHGSCRKSFCSKYNLEGFLKTDESIAQSTGPSTTTTNVRVGELFDIKKDCLICGKIGTLRKKKLVAISTGTGSGTRGKLLNSAFQRQDNVM